MTRPRRVMIVGLDCVAPEIVFDDMRSELPVLSGLMERGAWGKLESCDPPITVPLANYGFAALFHCWSRNFS